MCYFRKILTLLVFLFLINETTHSQSVLIVTRGEDSGTGSLRQVILEAASGDTISFSDDIDTVSLTSGELLIDKSLVIEGNPGRTCILRSDTTLHFRIFRIRATDSVSVEFSYLSICGGHAHDGNGAVLNGEDGGGICVPDSIHELVLNDCRINENHAGDGYETYGVTTTGNGGNGGGIYSLSKIQLYRCQISDNMAGKGADASSGGDWNYQHAGSGGNGGGIYCLHDLLLQECSIHSNQCGAGGSAWGGTYSSGGGGGTGGSGGGIYGKFGLIRIISCIMDNNASGTGGNGINSQTSCSGGTGGNGGALFISESQFTIFDSELIGNETGTGGSANGNETGHAADGGSGGGIYAGNSIVDITAVEISGNHTGKGGFSSGPSPGIAPGNGGNGGGICLGNCQVLMDHSIIENNFTGNGEGTTNPMYGLFDQHGNGGNAGGVWLAELLPNSIITNCFIRGNYTGNGGICTNLTPYGNRYASGGHGGGLVLYQTDPVVKISNCEISGNWCGHAEFKTNFPEPENNSVPKGGSGGGAYLDQSSPYFINSTVSDNSAGSATLLNPPDTGILTVSDNIRGKGGGVYPANGIFNGINSIIARNFIINYLIDNDIEGDWFLTYSLVSTDTLSSQIPGQGNLVNTEPEFVAFPDDLSLSALSHAINHGTLDTTGLFLPETDLAGNPRIYGDRIDMGAYEFQGEPSDQYTVSTDLIVMDSTVTGSFSVDSLTIFNHGSQPLIIDAETSSPFSLSLDKTGWNTSLPGLTIPEGQTVSSLQIYVKFESPSAGDFQHAIAINTENSSCLVTVKGYCKSMESVSEQSDKLNVNIFPNPFKNETSINYLVEQQGDVRINLFNSSGIIISEILLPSRPKGLNSYLYQNHDLKPGIYFLELTSGNSRMTAKVIKAFEE